MSEQLSNNRQEPSPKPQAVDFLLSPESLAIIRRVLDRPSLPPNKIAAVKVFHMSKDLHHRLPLSINNSQVPVSLTSHEVDCITVQIDKRKFNNTEEGQKLQTGYAQALWDVNVGYYNASGETASNFKVFLKRYSLLEYEIK